jgi:hypothetical protein|tara:strand:+ start:1846 stop:1989 length:144 start_codon:yes stop_codon:yes gene_type:complete
MENMATIQGRFFPPRKKSFDVLLDQLWSTPIHINAAKNPIIIVLSIQ